MRRAWGVWLTKGAERDFFSILRWTTVQFGMRQARVYETTLRSALKALASGPNALGCQARPELGADVASLHTARQGHKARHIIVFRAHEKMTAIEVLRILHDSMDLAQHMDS